MPQRKARPQQDTAAPADAPATETRAPEAPAASRIHPYDPASEHRVIRERLHGLDMINQRFARRFRVGLFNLIRRSADVSTDNVRYQSYQDYVRNVAVPTNLNLVNMKPLRGTALVAFPPEFIYMVVDNLFGGDGRVLPKSEGREFTNTEQRIIRRLLDMALDQYRQCWQAVYPLDMSFVRAETQAKFANITNTPNEIIVNTTFHVDVGEFSSQFQICIPYAMIEPVRELLTNPASGTHEGSDNAWTQRIAGKIRHSEIEVVAEFATIPSHIRRLGALKPGDVLPMELPKFITARVDGVPVLECAYGSHKGQLALRVLRVINHAHAEDTDPNTFIPGPTSPTQDADHE